MYKENLQKHKYEHDNKNKNVSDVKWPSPKDDHEFDNYFLS